MSKKNLEEIYEQFVGSGKVQSLKLERVAENKWEWTYKEGKKTSSIIDEDREYLEKMHMEFGGRNPETCRAPDKFLQLDGWAWDDVSALGHQIMKIRIKGINITKNKKRGIELPKGTGSNQPIKSKRNLAEDTITFIEKGREEAELTRAFSNREEFDNFKQFLFTNVDLKEMTFYVTAIGTESRNTGDQCAWLRVNAGDGTRRMILQLDSLNSKHFTKCKRADLFNAADDMFDTPCQRIDMDKPKEFLHKTVCLFAAEDGQVDIEGYSVSPEAAE